MWQHIRTFGELHILTRASYFMLVFIPILAGLWPAVRVAINRYNDAITHCRTTLEAAADRIEFAVSTAEASPDAPSRVTEIVNELNTQLEGIFKEYAPKAIENPRLPSVWALAFLASLSVTIAHLIYQAIAPSLIRQMNLREFIESEVKRFVESPSDGQLEQAQYFSEGPYSPSYESKRTKGQEPPADKSSMEEKKEAIRRREVAIIQDGAAGLYYQLSCNGVPAAVASGIFYLIGLALIIWITVSQTINVASAAWGA